MTTQTKFGRARARAAAGLSTLAVVAGAPAATGTAHAQEAPGAARATETAHAPVKRLSASLQASARRLHVLAGGAVTVAGYLRPAAAGRTVRLQRRVGRGWRTLSSARTAGNGRYALRFRATRTGVHLVRVVFGGDAANAPAVRQLGRLSVYRRTVATYYTLYGGPLACGGRLGYNSLVVAHRTLPCGTRVTVRFRGRTVRARVMDRGPFVGGREFDLAGAVARRLGFDGVRTVWVSVSR